MTIATYAELQTAVASWLHRSDLTLVIPDFIRLAEERLNNDLKARLQVTKGTVAATAGNAYITLPTGVQEIMRVEVQASPVRVLTPMSADQLSTEYPDDSSGLPSNYAVIGDELQFGLIPDSAYDIGIVYRAKLPALASNSTNWLLTANPSCYLYAALMSAAPYIADDALLQRAQMLYTEALERLNLTDWCTVSTPRVRSR